jgi:hypothetical protein
MPSSPLPRLQRRLIQCCRTSPVLRRRATCEPDCLAIELSGRPSWLVPSVAEGDAHAGERQVARGDHGRVLQGVNMQLTGWYVLTELLTRLAGTGETERDADDGHQDHAQVSETR